MLRAGRWLAFGSSSLIIVGIAPSQILLGLALAALLLSGEELRLPPIKLPLGLFLLGTLVAVAFSGDPVAGWPQIRKFYVFSQLLVVFSLLMDLVLIRWLFLSWAALGSLSALLSFVQFAAKVRQAQESNLNIYNFYVGERITGFMSHWYTFSALEMFILIMLASFLFFAPQRRRRIWVWLVFGLLSVMGLLLAETRGVWIATAAAGLYLLWSWRRWVVLVTPVILAAGIFLSPNVIRQRFTSILHPAQVDSNQFRVVTWRTGLRMIERHPWLGLGPEMPRIHFDEYVPEDIPRPLPEGSYIHLHNIYLHYAAERGIPTLLAFLWLMGKILRDFWRGLRALPPGPSDRRYLLQGGIATVLAVLVDGVANMNLGISSVLTMFLVVVACGYMALEQDLGPQVKLEPEAVPAEA
ncbi:MAG TPA: O-antigen ligase family protein [Bryobacteraceae bacterium]|nr:O-antigen ligase family protein [Bryobacteraceae bacterium]